MCSVDSLRQQVNLLINTAFEGAESSGKTSKMLSNGLLSSPHTY